MYRPKRGKRMSLAWYRSTLEELYRAYIREFGSCDPSRHDRPLHRGPFMQVWTRVRPQWLASYPFAPKTDPKENAKFQRCDGEIALHEIDWGLRAWDDGPIPPGESVMVRPIPSDFHEAIYDIPDWLAGTHLNQTGTEWED